MWRTLLLLAVTGNQQNMFSRNQSWLNSSAQALTQHWKRISVWLPVFVVLYDHSQTGNNCKIPPQQLHSCYAWSGVKTPLTNDVIMYLKAVCILSYIRIQTPASRRHWTNAGLMLVHRLRRWTNIKPALSQCLLFCSYSILFFSVTRSCVSLPMLPRSTAYTKQTGHIETKLV